MKKILISNSLLPLLEIGMDILSRDNIKIFAAPSADDIVKTHRIENVNLIIMELTETGDNIEKVCSIIRNDDALNKVSILLICFNQSIASMLSFNLYFLLALKL